MSDVWLQITNVSLALVQVETSTRSLVTHVGLEVEFGFSPLRAKSCKTLFKPRFCFTLMLKIGKCSKSKPRQILRGQRSEVN